MRRLQIRSELVMRGRGALLRELSGSPLEFNPSSHGSVWHKVQVPPSPDSLASFGQKLKESIASLKNSKKSAIYLKVSMDQAHTIAIASSLGFRFHNAEGTESTLLLWLLEDTPCKVPMFATHHLGVGGLVLNEGKILVVKENGENTKWKLPGGLADLGEDIDTAVCREIREETGVESAFKSILSVRHQHKVQFGRSDIYFTCLLAAKSSEITVDEEIKDATWMTPEQLRQECTFPTVLKALEYLSKNQMDKAFVKKDCKTYANYRGPYELYASNTLNVENCDIAHRSTDNS